MLNSKLEIGGFTWNDRLELCISNCLVFRMCHSFKSKATEKKWEKKQNAVRELIRKVFVTVYMISQIMEFGSWKRKSSKCYWIQKQIEPFSHLPRVLYNIIHAKVLSNRSTPKIEYKSRACNAIKVSFYLQVHSV